MKRNKTGQSLIECAVAATLLLVVLTSIFSVLSSGQQAAMNSEAGLKAHLLARGLLEEILAKAFEEPGTAGSFGREGGEKKKDRRQYDDVDDYDAYGPYSPPLEADGEPMTGFGAFVQSVTVENVSASDFGSVRADGTTPFKRVRVNVKSAAPGEADVALELIAGRK